MNQGSDSEEVKNNGWTERGQKENKRICKKKKGKEKDSTIEV